MFVLERAEFDLNRELGADFDLNAFEHRAFFNDEHSRIEMHLISRRSQVVHLRDSAIEIARNECIRTECSYKYSHETFRDLAAAAGFTVEQTWTDDQGLFSVQYLTVAGSHWAA